VFDRSGARVLTPSDDSTARLWDAATGARTSTCPVMPCRRWPRVEVDAARLWDAATGAELAVLSHDRFWSAVEP
jgi:WD40 repeat protein